MKRLVKNFCTAILTGAVCMMYSCTSDELLPQHAESEASGWHSAKARINVVRAYFDDQTGKVSTKARNLADGWQDGDIVYMLFTDKDGGKVQAYAKFDGTSGEWGDVEYDGYKSTLVCNQPRKVEAYFFDGAGSVTSTSIALKATTGVYTCLDGTYIYPSDGDLEVNISLQPVTSRIRFVGNTGTSCAVAGMMTYTSFSRLTGELLSTATAVSATVQSDFLDGASTITGSTPYLYGTFADTAEPTFLVTTGGHTFKTVFEPGTSILHVGRSGYMNLPTAESHRGWKEIITATGISLDKTFLELDNQGEYEPNTYALKATITPANATEQGVVWTSSNASVASVTDAGVVTAKARGTATITATSKENGSFKATCTVKVIESTMEFNTESVYFTMKLVEAGTFSMGSYNDGSYVTNYHQVTLTYDYYIGETEVTQALWEDVMGYTPTSSGKQWSSTIGLGDDYPAYNISYEDVQSFISKLNSITGRKFRMPTEAEWEFAAKGGNKSKGYTYSGSNTIDNVAWYTVNSHDDGISSPDYGTHEVASKQPNELGLYDMSGNVWEWCSDWYGSYSSSAQTNPTGPSTGSYRVIRGGGWVNSATYSRSANRNYYTPSDQANGVGFRLCL